jgi:multicomponent Na+:H+ antiporter subunit E
MSRIVVVLTLATVWVLLWGSLTFANVLSGVLIGVLLVAAVPGLRRRQPGRAVFRPWPFVRLLAYFVHTVVESNVILTREILSRRPSISPGIIGIPLPDCSAGVLTVIFNMLALTPGTMPLEIKPDPTTLYVHILHLRDVEQSRRELLHSASLVINAFGTTADVAALKALRQRPPPEDEPR